ncbi:DUF3566 domain-containing protein [Rhodococcus coprophilus]|uniref:Transmembrane domain of uncharacterized function (DUF3566) n=1 Tax=Rhodococcus coprophilus TaxID=38310 RepID=A0A2X4U2U9_9NOCA|nr:DUF3566 domain-containing protein [Rhodococcus coprophilus]MBM7458808.1 hypothetical protein [Rhodococcus coprophilus]SQI33553.1 Transmembrane domain of uncharacterised function (DUF3566) [Rhodococcus coprophilus]
MSTPQGPNGNGQGKPGPRPEDRNGQEVPSGSSGAAPSQGSAPQGASSKDRAPQDRSPQQDRAPQNAAPEKPAGPPQKAGEAAPNASSKPLEDAAKAAPPKQASAAEEPSAGAQKPAPADKPARTAPQGQAEEHGRQAPASPQPETPAVNNGAAPSAAKAQSSQGTDQSRPGRPANQTARPGGQTPPWQRGPQGNAQQGGSSPQKTPQTNLPGVGPGLGKTGPAGQGTSGSRPSTGAQPSSGKPAAAQNPAPPTRPVVTGTAAASMNAATSGSAPRTTDHGGNDRAAAKAKAAVIDGPTRHIERKDLAKDLPDLSAVKHPTPAGPATGETPKVGPTAIAPAVAGVATGDALRATVQLRRIDPWSMLKISSVISVSLFFVWMIAVGLLYAVLAGMGVWDRLNSAFTDIVSDAGSDGLVTVGQVFGYATVIGLANMVLMTALATLGAFIYNLCTDLVGGVQVTLADPD